jgi:hypothetical protein
MLHVSRQYAHGLEHGANAAGEVEDSRERERRAGEQEEASGSRSSRDPTSYARINEDEPDTEAGGECRMLRGSGRLRALTVAFMSRRSVRRTVSSRWRRATSGGATPGGREAIARRERGIPGSRFQVTGYR